MKRSRYSTVWLAKSIRCHIYVEFALANYREPVTQKLLAEAVAEYAATKEHEREQDLISEPYLIRLKRDLVRLQKHFSGATVAELTGARLVG